MKSVGIYGAGWYGEVFYEALTSMGYEIQFFLDKYISLQEKYGLPIFRPEAAVDKTTTIFISVAKYEHQIKEELSRLGFSNVRTFSDSIRYIYHIFDFFAKRNSLWLVENKDAMVDEVKIGKVAQRLKDEKSKELLSTIVRFRRTLDALDYVFPDGEEEYFTRELDILSRLKDKIRFVDGGGYIGDTLQRICQLSDNVSFIASFEPDPKNFQALRQSLHVLQHKYQETIFTLYPVGLWSHFDLLEFHLSGSSTSCVTKGQTKCFVPVCSIDETLFGAAPNFIKLDVEGAEKEALLGAKASILAYHPFLAVSLYHRPSDLWEIPLLIDEIAPGHYDFYLRVHEHMGLSTILYCVPTKGEE
ncbi:MAG: FkbM family methyltransferase [Campylobacterales bacterium]